MYKKQAMKVFLPICILVIGVLSLAGCGGGGGSKPATVYQAMGTGVIMQSKSYETAGLIKSASFMPINASLKQLDLTARGFRAQTVGTIRATAAVTADFLSKNVTYIFLTWDKVPNATHYQISYNGNKVWDSSSVSSSDPAFSLADPQAYLDLDGELSMITAAGTYSFQINALNGDAVVYQFSTVSASLGMTLGNFPTDITYASGTQQLAWTGVTGANGYRVRIYSDSTYTTRLYDSGATLISGTSYSLAGKGLTTGTYYGVIVDAIALDGSGRALEITRGIGGLTY